MKRIEEKREVLEKILIEKILNGTYPLGGKIPTEKKLSETLSISRTTVRAAVDQLQNQGFLKRKQGSGTYVQDTAFKIIKKGQKSPKYKIGFVFSTHKFRNEICVSFVEKFRSLTKDTTAVVTYFHYFLKPEIYRRDKINFLVIDDSFPEKEIASIPNNLPVIVFNRNREKGNFIAVDNLAAGYMMIEYLAKMGHRKILTIAYEEDPDRTSNEFSLRHQGIMNGIKDFGLEVVLESLPLFKDLYRLRRLFSQENFLSHNFTAVACLLDRMAINFLEVADDYGLKIPEEISVIGFDDRHFDKYLSTPLTTIKYPANIMAEMLAESFDSFLKNGNINIRKLVKPAIIERESVKCLSRNKSKSLLKNT